MFITVSECSTRRVPCCSKQKERLRLFTIFQTKISKIYTCSYSQNRNRQIIATSSQSSNNCSPGNNLIDLIRSSHFQNCNFSKLAKFLKTPFSTEHRTTTSVHYRISNQSFISCVYENMSV